MNVRMCLLFILVVVIPHQSLLAANFKSQDSAELFIRNALQLAVRGNSTAVYDELQPYWGLPDKKLELIKLRTRQE